MEFLIEYAPQIGGFVVLLVISLVNFFTVHNSELPPGARQKLSWLVGLIAFLDKNGFFNLVKIPLVPAPKPKGKPPKSGTTLILSILALVFVMLPACTKTFPVILDGTRIAIDETGKSIVEPALKIACMKRAKKCRADGLSALDECKPDTECRGWLKTYFTSAALVEDQLAILNRLWWTLKKEKVIK